MTKALILGCILIVGAISPSDAVAGPFHCRVRQCCPVDPCCPDSDSGPTRGGTTLANQVAVLRSDVAILQGQVQTLRAEVDILQKQKRTLRQEIQSSKQELEAQPVAAFRQWTDETGKVSVVAKLTRADQDTAYFTLQSGKRAISPLANLSEQDQRIVQAWRTAMHSVAKN